MAYSKKPQEEHDFKRIAADVKKRDIASINIVYGTEDYLVRWAGDSIRRTFVDEAAEMFDFTELDGTRCSSGDIISACETMPMMSERRVVIVTDFPAGSGSVKNSGVDEDPEDTETENDTLPGSAVDLEELTSYFETFPDSTVLVLICRGNPDKRRKFFKTAMKKGREYNMKRLDVATFNGFVRKRLGELGCSCDSNMVNAISYATGYFDTESEYRIDNLVGDLSKLAAYCEGTVTRQAIEETITGNNSVYVFNFVDAVLAGRRNEALKMFEQMLENESNLFGLLGLICSQFETVLLVSEMRGAGMDRREIASRLKIHEFRVKKAWEACRSYSDAKLRRILMKAYEINRNVKTGKFPIETSMELFIAGI